MKATPDKIKKEVVGIHFEPETPDGKIELEFGVEESGTYKISAVLVDDIFGGVYQPFVDDQPAGPILDMVSNGGDWSEYNFGVFKLNQGLHKFKLQGKGASPNRRPSLPEKYSVGISSLILLRLEDL